MTKYDFDSWDEEAASAAIARIAETQTAFRYLIDAEDLIVELPSKKIAKLPLSVTARDMLQVAELEQRGEAALLMQLLDNVAQKDTLALLQDCSLALVAKIAMVYFDLIGQITGVALGE